MKIRYDMSHIDLATDDPEKVDLTHLPEWLEPQVRGILRRMDFANKETKADPPINIAGHIDVDVPGIGEGEEWKSDLDVGGGEIVRDLS